MAYTTKEDLKAEISIDDSIDDVAIELAINAACREIDLYCNRTFEQATGTSIRQFRPVYAQCDVADISTTTGLVVAVDLNDDGTAEKTLTATDYVLEPLNGVGSDQNSGWPYTRIIFRYETFDDPQTFPEVHVTARWGWPAVPAPVKKAANLLAVRNFKLKDAPFGVAGFGEYGAVRVKDHPVVEALLRKYQRVEDEYGVA